MKLEPEVAIRIENVSKTFKLPHEKTTSIKNLVLSFRKRRTFERQQALKDVSFEINKGDFFGIVGRNGSGKSTLLKMLAGIYLPTQGNILVNGTLTPFIELGVGFNPELTGRENVYLNGALLGFNRKEMNKLYNEIVDFAEIERFMDQKLKNYSSGMQVRLAFSIAIRAKSDILLIDEVLAVGDIAFQKKCIDYFDQLKKDKQTVILVSHDMATVEKHCNKVVLVNEGELIDSGDPKEMAAKYRLLNLPKQDQEDSAVEGSKKLFGQVSINEVSINGQPNAVVSEHDELTIKTTFTPKKTRNFVVAVSIKKSDGHHIAYFDSRVEYKKLSGEKDTTYSAVCSFKAKPFLEGAYEVSVDLYDDNDIYLANKNNAVQFSVMNTGSDKAGLVNVDSNWQIKELKS